jgi:L-fuconolactonase
LVIDSHAHIAERWFEPLAVLEFQMQRIGAAGAVLVQMGGELDNDYQQRCAASSAARYVSVVSVDLAADDIRGKLSELRDAGASGVRLYAAGFAGNGRGVLALQAADELGLAVSCYGSSEEFMSPAFKSAAELVPATPIVIEHMGELLPRNRALSPEKAAGLYKQLADLPNVSMKFHGPGEMSDRSDGSTHSAFARDVVAVIKVAYDIMGPSRLMWGSGFPSCSGREGYLNCLRYAREALVACGMSAAEEQMMFQFNARKIFWK